MIDLKKWKRQTKDFGSSLILEEDCLEIIQCIEEAKEVIKDHRYCGDQYPSDGWGDSREWLTKYFGEDE